MPGNVPGSSDTVGYASPAQLGALTGNVETAAGTYAFGDLQTQTLEVNPGGSSSVNVVTITGGLTMTGNIGLTGQITGSSTGKFQTLAVSGGASTHAGCVTFGNGTATTATAGSQTLPTNPVGFLVADNNGTAIKIPYYAT